MSKINTTQSNIIRSIHRCLFTAGIIIVGSIFSLSNAQTRVTGSVTEAGTNEPLPGVTVNVKGISASATMTDNDGNYSINVSNANVTLVFTAISYATQEVPLRGRTSVNVVLETEEQQLVEVVVTGMTVQDKRLSTGATDKISADKALLGGIADISRSLEGRSASVSVQNVSGTFGTAPKIRVRGATSIYGNSKPLWVVDGVVQEDAIEVSVDQLSSGDAVTLISSAIAGLNADDIESFDILKDGSATSIYGARAMAGVIVVTTKKGKKGSSKISYSGEFSMRLKPSYRQFNIANSQEQMGIYKEMELKGWLELSAITKSTSSGVYGKMYQLVNTYDETNGNYGLPHTQAAMNAYLREAEFRNTDWFDLLFDNSITQNHAVSISGGTENARFYTSLSAMFDPGWTQRSSVNRYTVNANAGFDLSKAVTLNLLANGSTRKQQAPGTLSQEVDVVSGEVKRGFDINPYSYALNTSRTMDPRETYTRNYAPFNIFDELENNYIDMSVSDIKFQGDLTWKPITGLMLNGLAAVRYSTTTQEHFVKDNSNQAKAYRAGIEPEDATIRDANRYLYTDPSDANAVPVTVLPKGGIYFNNQFTMVQTDLRATASYNFALGKEQEHVVSLFGGAEQNAVDRNKVYFQGWGYCYDNGGQPFVDPNLFKQQSEENQVYYENSWTWNRSVAFFAQGTYSYKQRYVVSATGRYEGTNKLGKSRQARWLPTYNISGMWHAHEENFFKKIEEALSHATVRVSYSLTADRGPADVSNALVIYLPDNPWRPVSTVRETGMRIDRPGNTELTYEKKYEFNVGVDLGFLNNRLNLVMDVYTRDNFDLIGTVYTQGAGGFIAKMANTANMSSKGVEATISTKNIVNKGKGFNWTTDFTFSWINNKITNLASRSNIISLVQGEGFAMEGYPVRALFSIPFVGLNDEGLPMFMNENGEITVSDINFQEYDPEKLKFLKYEGSTDPNIIGGFGNIFTFKGFRLNTFITYSFGNKVRLDPVFSYVYSDQTALPKEFKNRWVLPGDEAITDIPTIASLRQSYNDRQLSYAYNAYNYSTARVADGGFIRMKEISLTYDFEDNITNFFKIANLSLKLQATNLFLIYADKKLNGQDPEFMNAGGVATPMPRQFTLSVRAGL
ncbi:MAG: SusC/RagA family TonB-linked outer membrane protein [Prevotellaceae bacterium]|jgi:TonB-linked SusC/RagA family outer membrane protein|nr:SusC/RagA family TonB-linked outer membrane protein [Prevotellaceae bacterium]